MVATTKSVVSARRRAHEARVRLQADRAERDRRIEEQVTRVLTAAGDIAAAESARAAAAGEMARAVAALAGDGLSAADIATLIEVPDRQVRQLIRDGQADASGVSTARTAGRQVTAEAAASVAGGVAAGDGAERATGMPSEGEVAGVE